MAFCIHQRLLGVHWQEQVRYWPCQLNSLQLRFISICVLEGADASTSNIISSYFVKCHFSTPYCLQHSECGTFLRTQSRSLKKQFLDFAPSKISKICAGSILKAHIVLRIRVVCVALSARQLCGPLASVEETESSKTTRGAISQPAYQGTDSDLIHWFGLYKRLVLDSAKF